MPVNGGEKNKRFNIINMGFFLREAKRNG